MDQNQIEPMIHQILAALEAGVPLDWTDLRIYMVVTIAAGLGSVLGAFIASYFSKRGEIKAIKKDLDQITQIQEQIRAKISGDLWVNQNIWNLKRETYWKITTVLGRLSSSLWEFMREGFLPDKRKNMSAKIDHMVDKIWKIIDELIDLTPPTYIVLSDEAVSTLNNLHNHCQKLNKEAEGADIGYEYFESMEKVVSATYDKVIKIARKDLAGY